MPYWILAFAVALVVVIGTAAGPFGAVVALIAFSVALFLLWAQKLGYMGAWTTFGLDRFAAPFLDDANRERFSGIFSDMEKVGKACTIAVVLIALSLLLPGYQVGILVIALAAWWLYQIRLANRPASKVIEGPLGAKVVFPRAESRDAARVN
ncbi:MAG: hypothetical protein HZA68_21745 [Rhodovulum sp.]|nr:hypothetical protein [Rhodovulum sp.]